VAVNFDSEGFLDYLQSLVGRKRSLTAAKAIAVDVIKYYECFPTQNSYYETILNMENLRAYLQSVQEDRGYSATTIAEKIRRLRNAVDFVMFKENTDKTNTNFYIRCQKVNDNLKKWGKGMCTDIQKQQNRQAVESRKEVIVS